jgi:hypothetical protein
MNAEGLMEFSGVVGGKPARASQASGAAKPGMAERIMGAGRDPGDRGGPARPKRMRAGADEGDLNLD